MFKKTSFYVVLLIIGIVLACCGIYIPGEELKAVKGILLGLGAGIFGASIAKIYMIQYFKKNPEAMKQNEIDLTDERNTIIRYRAKAKAGDITQWLIILVAIVTILIDAPLWLTLSLVVVYLLYTILGIYFTGKYNKEM